MVSLRLPLRFRLVYRGFFAFCLLALLSELVRIPDAYRSIHHDVLQPLASSLNTPQPSRALAAPNMNAPFPTPLMFIENVGQFGTGTIYQLQNGKDTLWLTHDALWMTIVEPAPRADSEALNPFASREARTNAIPRLGVNVRLRFLEANSNPRLEPFQRLNSTVSYFRGSDPNQWQPDVPVWGGVRYIDLYPGIDLELTSEGGQLHPRFVVRNSDSLHQVQLLVEGVEHMTLVGANSAYHTTRLDTKVGPILLPLFELVHPDGTAFGWSTSASLAENRILTPFASLGRIAHTRQLAIDGGGLSYSTFLGGGGDDSGSGIAVDALSNVYITGYTNSTNFPTAVGVFDTSLNGGLDAFVTKLNADGNMLVYSTFLGGGNPDFGNGIMLDATGNAYITGRTSSPNFPTRPGSYDTSYNGGGSDAFMAKLNSTGTALVYSTFLGGANLDSGNKIALDSAGNAYVTGSTLSPEYPTTSGVFDASHNAEVDVFVTKLSASGNALLYSTFLGDANDEYGDGIAVDTAGNAYITGYTDSSAFPTSGGAFDTSPNGSYDAFVSKLNPTATTLLYSTFIGGQYDEHGDEIVIDGAGNAYITGDTNSGNFPTRPGAVDTTFNGGYDAFVTKLNPAGNALLYSTFLGGDGYEVGNGIALDGAGTTFITGYTDSADFPTTPGAFDTRYYGGGYELFITRLNSAGSDFLYSTLLGGDSGEYGNAIAVDPESNAAVTGNTSSNNFPTSPGAFDTSYNGANYDTFVTKLDSMGVPPPAVTPTMTSLPPTATPTSVPLNDKLYLPLILSN